MTRRMPPVAGRHLNGDAPPPSTLAAQIVHNQTRRAASPKNGESATFAQLLQEILSNPDAARQETDVNVNVQLINVVAEAGLAPLSQDNPFAQSDVLISQAKDSISVIERTIKQQPEVLLTPVSKDGPQLVLLLLARVTAASGRPKSQDVPVSRLLDTVITALTTSPDLWQDASIVKQALQEVIDETLSALEVARHGTSFFSVTLPSAKTVVKYWPGSQNAVALPQGYQVNVSDVNHAVMLVLQFMQISAFGTLYRDEAGMRLQQLVWHFQQKLEDAHDWHRAVEQLLLLSRNSLTLLRLLIDATKVKLPTEMQTRLARALIHTLRQADVVACEMLLPAMRALASDQVFDGLHEDFRIAVATWLTRFGTEGQLPEPTVALREALRQDNVMTDSELQIAFKQLSSAPKTTGPQERTRKRRRITDEDPAHHQVSVESKIATLLATAGIDDIQNLPEAAAKSYPSLTDDDQCKIWLSLADLSESNLSIALQTVTKLLSLSALRDAKRARVQAVIAVTKVVGLTTKDTLLDLAKSPLGQLCLSSLHSSIRELRLAAGRCLPEFLRDELPDHVKTKNRQIAMEYLRTLSDRDVASEHESLIFAWGQVAIACGDRELNLVLIRLVDYLGHPNPLICALAFAEVENIAAARKQSPAGMFNPFWHTIGPSAVRDMHTRPQKVQQLCDILEIDISAFLLMTQHETIPVMVLTKNREALQRIATARGNGASVREVCLQPAANLAATISLLLCQATQDPEEFARDCLSEVAPEFRGHDLSLFVKGQPELIACEMLKQSGDAPDSRKPRMYHAFQTFATLVERRPGQAKAHSKPSRIIADFFDIHVLGIMAHFSETLESTQMVSTVFDKIRCLNAIADMIRLAKTHVSSALAQIRACLQSAIEHADLREAAFSAWLVLLTFLDPDDLAHVLDQTFALIVQYWTELSDELQQATHLRIADLLKNHNQVVQEQIMTLPSLGAIPVLAKFSSEIERLKGQESTESHFKAFEKRLQSESKGIVHLAVKELVPFLELHQEFIHDSAISEQPALVLSAVLRALLDTTVRYSSHNSAIAELCGKALGVVGCLDPNRIETTRKRRQVLVLANFDKASEAVDWVFVLLEEVLVKAFKSVTNARAQGFLAYVIQELLRFSGFNEATASRLRSSQAPSAHQQWTSMPEHVRITLTPFLTSRYSVTTGNATTKPPHREYPGFSVDASHSSWLRQLVYDLMWKATTDNAKLVFSLVARTIRGDDLAISSFTLPYAILNVVLGGTVAEVQGLTAELRAVLSCKPTNSAQLETATLCSESVFSVLDYMSTWLQEKKKALGETRAAAYRTGQSPSDFDEAKDMAQVEEVERFLATIPAEAIASRALECGSYARALYNWEHYIRQQRAITPSARMSQREEDTFERLQNIYAQIDEPDGLEGIGAHLSFLTEEQQVVHHVKAGRWSAAQAWYELRLATEPGNIKMQTSLLECLRETGQYTPLLRYAENFLTCDAEAANLPDAAPVLSLATEARFMTCDLEGLSHQLGVSMSTESEDFNIGLGRLLVASARGEHASVTEQLSRLRISVAQGMTEAGTSSLQACHSELRKLHSLYELEAMTSGEEPSVTRFMEASDKRLAALGSYVPDKQHVLGIRRAIMLANGDTFETSSVGPLWLTTARLARKANNTQSAYNAVLQAYACGDQAAKLEEARLLWHDGHQRQAIQALDSAITSGIFDNTADTDGVQENEDSSVRSSRQSMLSARAHLLLSKWLDASGQSQAKEMTTRYQHAAKNFGRWEKGHYYLGKHYNKLLEAEKALPKNKQSSLLQSGEMTRLVVENLLRSVPFGNKYWHQTIPKVLTLWLDLGMQTLSKAAREDQAVFERRAKALLLLNRQMQKYVDRIPPYIFYTALPQIISRISHPHPDVWRQMSHILTKIGSMHPHQALWSLLAVAKASDKARADRGIEVLNRLKDPKNKLKTDPPGADLRQMITHGQKLSDGLLQACEAHVEPRTSTATLSKTLGFNHKLAPSALVVPLEATLLANLPSNGDGDKIRRHRPFAQDRISIQSFADEVLVLSSLQRPRKIVVRGSDGKSYGLLCKPKDDLRKDQRLMEFNGIINRALKRDAEASKRRLYIKTYAVTPLSEESGILEWVEGIKPIRDILLNVYSRKGIRPNYNQIRDNLNAACVSPEHAHIFVDRVQSQFPPSLHEWFSETYSEPDTWFAARLRYARSAAVMSMTGHVLGLGDRHGENILLEQSTGGVFHVDFNCLFDKGLTFEKPELVPFRLTPNMVDAMGAYGYEGPFRKSSELTLGLLRQNKDTLMTVLETFLYDPTTDFIGKKKRTTPGVPETPQEILDSVDGRLKGLLRGETVPLSVEGYVDALILQAVSNFNLASMYIGWCAFL